MTKLLITELFEVSFVDRPANPGAKILILKRDHTTPSKETNGMDKVGVQQLNKRLAELETSNEKLEKANLALTERAETAEKVAKLSGEERTYYDELDEASRAAFLKKTAKARGNDIKLAKDRDQAVRRNGRIIKRADVGDAVFEIVKAMADENDGLRGQVDGIKKGADLAAAVAVAEQDLPSIPGTPAEKGQVLHDIANNCDAGTQDAVLNMLKAAENIAKRGLGGPIGDEGSDAGEPGSRLTKRIEEQRHKKKAA